MEDMSFFFGMENILHHRNNDFKSFRLGMFDWFMVECVDRLEAINPWQRDLYLLIESILRSLPENC
jgi:hypothetical protein